MSTSIRIRILNILKALALPLLMAVFPVLFLYGNNVTQLILPSLERTLLLYSALAILIFGIACILFKGQVVKAANAACIFLIFFNFYGLLYRFLLNKNLFRVEHFTLLPFVLLLALYASWLATKLDPAKFWNGAVFVLSTLVIFNLAKIVPDEVKKNQIVNAEKATAPVVVNTTANKNYPDIYFIIFDEFAGFDTMRSYWKYQGVDDFVNFAKSKGFFVAENSHGNSVHTLNQVAERLNYKVIPDVGSNDGSSFEPDIINNRAMSYLKSLGYSTVVFNELSNQNYIHPINADYSFDYNSTKGIDPKNLFDNFGVLAADNTMLSVFSKYYKMLDPISEKRKNYIVFTADKLASLTEIPSPRFVYVHLSLPHFPFMLDEKGNPVDRKNYYNWNYYLGYYKYAITIAERMINNLLSNADPNRLPVIIIQSDHGARNGLATWDSDAVTFTDYPGGLSNHILNLMYIPGYDFSSTPQDINPINTFPIIFNHLFNANIPLQ